jgi:hypothetical protein
VENKKYGTQNKKQGKRNLSTEVSTNVDKKPETIDTRIYKNH